MSRRKYPLHEAAELGDLDRVKQLIKKKYDVNELDGRHWTPLHCAASSRQLAVCKTLLKASAEPTQVTSNNATALHYVSRIAEDPALQSVLKLLVEKKADVNAANFQGNTPLHEATLRGSLPAVNFLIANDGKVDQKNQFGEVPMHNAVRCNSFEVLQALLSAGAKADVAGKEGTPIQVAKRVFDDSTMERFNKMLLNNSATRAGIGSQLDVAYDYESLPEPVKQMAVQANLSPQTINQNFDKFAKVIRHMTGDKYLPSEEDSYPFTFGDPRELYKLGEISGSGGFGSVYFAKGVKNKKEVAIKKMSNKEEKQELKNLNEINLLRKCQGPHAVTYVESFLVSDLEEVWLVTEYMEGGTLNTALQKDKFTENQIAYVAQNILEGLQTNHGRYVVHRDIKSHNVMMTVQGDVKLVDFGLALDLAAGGKQSTVGTAHWMPPEVILKLPHTPAIDIYCMGMTILEMANGEIPNKQSKLLALFSKAIGDTPTFTNEAKWSAEMKDFVNKCLTYDYTARPTASELLSHQWLKTACSRTKIKDKISRIFLKGDLEDLGLSL